MNNDAPEKMKIGDMIYPEHGSKPMGGKVSTILRKTQQTRKKFPEEIEPATPPCGDCDACCRSNYIIDFTAGDDPNHFDADKEIKPRADGTCPHLGADGCEVYETRPAVCKVYDCRVSMIGGIAELGKDHLNEARRQWDISAAADDQHNMLHMLCFKTLCQSYVREGIDIENAIWLALATYEEQVPSLKKFLLTENIPKGYMPQLSVPKESLLLGMAKLKGVRI